MAGKVTNQQRDQLMTLFREAICQKMEIAPLVHQRRWWCAADGWELIEGLEDPEGVSVKLPDGSITKWMIAEREHGAARVIADLGAFKSGKSFGSALWLSGIAAVPGGQASLVGLEYDTVSPEFNYIVDFLLSAAGMGLKYDSLQNRPRDGKMWLDLPNGVTISAKSWERKETLKGKEMDIYLFSEAYQLPGLECYSSIKQNLVARDGFAVFPTTPDRPWIKELHDKGHKHPDFPKWECICGIPRSQNVHTYSATEEIQDKQLLTSEKFKIAHYGELGEFVGSVYNFQRGQKVFTSTSHPQLFRPGSTGTHEDLVVPAGWELVGGADTGTFSSALLVLFSPDGDAFVLEEFPNYRYVAGTAELASMTSIPGWANAVVRRTMQLGGRPLYWADANGQFKKELQNYSMTLLPNRAPVEARSEIAREYFDHKRIYLAPWLSVLPFELENAAWPEEASASGKFARVKDRDHTLDCLEHILSKRPRGGLVGQPKGTGRWLDQWAAANGAKKSKGGNVHLGSE